MLFRARTTGPASAVDGAGRPVRVSRPQAGRDVSDVHGWARSLAGPFDGMFGFRNARAAIVVNSGIAAVVYVFVGELTTQLLGRAHPGPSLPTAKRACEERRGQAHRDPDWPQTNEALEARTCVNQTN
jgi:hypothetical protein